MSPSGRRSDDDGVDLGKRGGSRNGRVPGGDPSDPRSPRKGGKAAAQQVPPTELLEREARTRRPAGIAAILAGVLPLIGLVVQGVAYGRAQVEGQVLSAPRAVFERAAGQPDGQSLAAASRVALGDQSALLIGAALAEAVGIVLLAYALHVVVQAVAGRRTSPVGIFGWLTPAGVALYGVGQAVLGVFSALRLAGLPADADYGQVVDVTQNPAPIGVQGVVFVLLALYVGGVVWTSLQAMATGLFTRFVGLIGVFTAIVVFLSSLSPALQQLDQFGILRAFWAIAIGVLLLGRWPRGEPPAWETGEARPWPTRAEMVEQLERDRARAQREREAAAADDDDDPAPRRPEGGGRRRRKR